MENGDGVGVGMDSCVLPTRHHGYYLVQTTDLYPYNVSINGLFFVALTTSSFYPLVEDPYFQVVSNLNADRHGDVHLIGEDSLC